MLPNWMCFPADVMSRSLLVTARERVTAASPALKFVLMARIILAVRRRLRPGD